MNQTFSSIVDRLISIGQPIIVLIMALALMYFLYGILKYMVNYGKEESRKESIQIMIHGLIALFVMVSVWGLVSLLVEFLGDSMGIPQF